MSSGLTALLADDHVHGTQSALAEGICLSEVPEVAVQGGEELVCTQPKAGVSKAY